MLAAGGGSVHAGDQPCRLGRVRTGAGWGGSPSPPCFRSVSPSARREKGCWHWKEPSRLLHHSALRIRDNEMENPNGSNEYIRGRILTA